MDVGGDLQQVGNVYECNIGGCPYLVLHPRRLVEHMIGIHGNCRNIRRSCGLEGCLSRLNTVDSFRTHVIRHHRFLWNPPLPRKIRREQVLNLEEFADDHLEDYGDVELEIPQSASELYTSARDWINSASLKLRLELEHVFEVPASVVKELHDKVTTFASRLHEKLSEPVMKRLDELGVQDENLSTLVQSDNALHAMRVTKTQAKRKLASSVFVEPKRICLRLPTNRLDADNEEEDADDPPDHTGVDAEVQEEEAQEVRDEDALSPCHTPSGVMHYVPILETLKAYLRHDDVVDSIKGEVTGPHMEKYLDGALFQGHPIFSTNPSALRIILYMDELEVCNPIGSSKGVHKVSAVYFSVGNIPQYHLSSLSSIHLALISEFSNIDKYTYTEVMAPIVQDLKKLQEEGISVTTKSGREFHWIGSVAFICGDNLSQNHIGGFRRCFRSGRMCRFCMADFSQLPSLLTEDSCILRNSVNHQYHVQSVLEDVTLINMYGVTGACPFDELGVGAPFELCAPDIMHDIHEGVMSTHITLLLRKLSKDKVIVFETARAAKLNFKYGVVDKRNKHRGLSKKFMRKGVSLSGTASQRWALFHILPLAIGHLVPADNEYWRLFILTTQICEIIMAPIIEVEWVYVLQELLEEHHALWVRLYPGTATYKWHVLLHYPRFLLLYGPLRHVWTMRFEAFHQFFKRIARKLNNFICISKTLSYRFQRKRCIELDADRALPEELIVKGAQKTMNLLSLPLAWRSALKNHLNCPEEMTVLRVTEIAWCGMRLISKCIVIVDLTPNGDPRFLQIDSLFVVGGEPLIVGTVTRVCGWNSHVNGYCVVVSQDDKDVICIKPCSLKSHQSLDLYVIGDDSIVKLRNRVSE